MGANAQVALEYSHAVRLLTSGNLLATSRSTLASFLSTQNPITAWMSPRSVKMSMRTQLVLADDQLC
jgi:hypothetical protein